MLGLKVEHWLGVRDASLVCFTMECNEQHSPNSIKMSVPVFMLKHGIMGRRFPDGGLLRYRK